MIPILVEMLLKRILGRFRSITDRSYFYEYFYCTQEKTKERKKGNHNRATLLYRKFSFFTAF